LDSQYNYLNKKMADHEVLSVGDVWKITDALQAGEQVDIEWRTRGKGQRFKSRSGVVVRESDVGGAGSLRYATVHFHGLVKPSMFPEDGKNGTHEIEYRVIEVSTEEEFTPSPIKVDPVVLAKPGRVTSKLPDRVAALAARQQDEMQQFEDCVDEFGPEEDSTNYHEYEHYLNPSSWHMVCRSDIDLLKAQMWMRQHFKDALNSHVAADNFTFTDLVDIVCDNLAAAYELPGVVTSKHWVGAMELLLARLVMQVDRVNGASAAQLNAVQRGFKERRPPQWLKQTRERGAQLLAQPDPFRPHNRGTQAYAQKPAKADKRK
jgi:hypothetical protein